MKQNFLCTRQNLATELITRGKEAKIVANPWKPELNAWLFQIDDELSEIVISYYEALGQQPPKKFRK